MRRLRRRRILFASFVSPLLAITATCAQEPAFEGDVTDVTTIDTLNPDGPHNKIWEPYLAKWSKKHYLALQKEFYVAGNRNSYPTLIEDKPGEWLAVWDSSNNKHDKRTAIRFGRLQVGK